MVAGRGDTLELNFNKTMKAIADGGFERMGFELLAPEDGSNVIRLMRPGCGNLFDRATKQELIGFVDNANIKIKADEIVIDVSSGSAFGDVSIVADLARHSILEEASRKQ